MASGARTLRKTPSISRAGKAACGKGVTHGVFSGSWRGRETSAAAAGRWGVCSATRVAVVPLTVSSSSLHAAGVGDTAAGIAGTRDAEPQLPAWRAEGTKKSATRSRKVMTGKSLGLQAQCFPQCWEHELEGSLCEPQLWALQGGNVPLFLDKALKR